MPSSWSTTGPPRCLPRSSRPRDKGNVEAGVKVVTNWVIHYLADRTFASLDELNDAIAAQVEVINGRTPFRGETRNRRDWFEQSERHELLDLPEQRWEPVAWRTAKVHRDWHIQIDSIKYSVPYRFAGLGVDVRIIGDTLDVIADGEIIATHQRGQRSNGYVTDPEHQPAHLQDSMNLWTRGYFLRQAGKVGPATVTALEQLLDEQKIEAQGFRSCMNILDLGKRGNRALLEQACRQLTDTDADRRITYTAVKNHITALRAQQDQRPATDPAGGRPEPGRHRSAVLRATPAAPTWPGPPRSASTRSPGPGSRPTMPDQHLTDDDMPLFTRLRMTAFGEAVIDIANDPTCDQWTFSQKIGTPWNERPLPAANGVCSNCLKASRTPNPAACVEDIHHLSGRSINRDVVARLGSASGSTRPPTW